MGHTTTSPPVTVIGLGPMGRAIAGAFLAAGHPTTVWNRTADKAGDLLTRGATWADGPQAALQASELTVVCVVDADAVEAVLDRALAESDHRRLPATTLVNLTSEAPRRTRELALRVDGLGMAYLDGAIMTPAAVIGTETTRILYSGPAALLDRHRPTLAALGGAAVHLGADPGRAATFDVALLNLFWTSITGLMHSFALAARQEVPATALAPHAQQMAQLMADLLPALAAEIDGGSFSGEGSAALTSVAASLEHIVHALDETEVPSAVTRAAKEVVDAAVAAGHGGDAPVRLAEFLSRGAAAGQPPARSGAA
ncbi:6-phosphogluconate dehydrogenase [Microtetraspora sp. NBRC 13810]|uniref:NAD(P)-dependent oxidoreductase n=1 Tax=Microtetraspora sp. NBRC 13810 TaxID=3030990 RepID=UPI0024A241C3|nr:NAD(P)-binding domain-containing protein [Microtetraspora sp. NBRC 13810]GLW08086.1 6-phosphogluconate dehydrogenase [Microtetraspora sp. NBRC 13810]